MVRDPRSRSFGVLWIVLFAMGSVVAMMPCTALLDFGADPGAGRPRQTWSLALVLWAAAEIAVTPFVIGRNLDRVVLPTGWRAGAFYGGIALRSVGARSAVRCNGGLGSMLQPAFD